MTCTATFSAAPNTYQWLRNGTPISGANASAYKAVAADLGTAVACVATATNAVGPTSSTSAPRTVLVGPALRAVTRPVILGKAKVGKVLHATKGAWSPAAVSYRYVWLRNGKVIKHSRRAAHTVVAADVGKKLTVRVTAIRTGWASGVVLTPVRRVR
jgi:hypothetical protein